MNFRLDWLIAFLGYCPVKCQVQVCNFLSPRAFSTAFIVPKGTRTLHESLPRLIDRFPGLLSIQVLSACLQFLTTKRFFHCFHRRASKGTRTFYETLPLTIARFPGLLSLYMVPFYLVRRRPIVIRQKVSANIWNVCWRVCIDKTHAMFLVS